MPATITKRKRGRPRKPDSEKRRNNVTIRMRDAVKRELEEAASSAGRSLSEEIEFRLEQKSLEEKGFGGRELLGLLRLMVGAAEIVQGRTGKSWLEDWDTWNAVQAAWKRFNAEMGPKPPPEFVEYLERSIEPPPPPKLPPIPLYPYSSGLFPGAPKPEQVEAYNAERAVFDKSMRENTKRMKKWERQEAARQRETQQWLERTTSYRDLGREVAADLFPDREAVTETGNPS